MSKELTYKSPSQLIMHCEQPELLKTAISEGFYNAISMYTKEVPEKNIQIMMPVLLEKYKHEPVSVFMDVIKDMVSGKRKIYGLVTPHDIKEMITEKLVELALNRERSHEKNKGFAGEEIREKPKTLQETQPIKDHFNKKLKKL